MGNTFKARWTFERRPPQCLGKKNYLWVKKLNLSPNISVTRYLSQNSVNVITSLVRPAINGSLATNIMAQQAWLIALAARTLLLARLMMPYAGPSVMPGGGIHPGVPRNCSN